MLKRTKVGADAARITAAAREIKELSSQTGSMRTGSSEEQSGMGGMGGGSILDVAPPRLETLKTELDELVAADCPICGDLLVQDVCMPFIDPVSDAEEIKAWALPRLTGQTY